MITNNRLKYAFELLDNWEIKVPQENEVSIAIISDTELRLNLKFPIEYKEFILNYGCLVRDDLVIFGLGVPRFMLPNVESAYLLARSFFLANAPNFYLPIHMLNKGVFACIDCSQNLENGKIVVWDTSELEISKNFLLISNSFGEYLEKIILDQINKEKAFLKLEEHVKEFAAAHKYSHATGGKLPSNNEWRPYRFCVQDILLGATVVCHSREKNILEVDVFLSTDIPNYEVGSGVKALAVFILSEAYKCGGTMEIQFTPNVDGGKVPIQLQNLAKKYGLNFQYEAKGRITSKEAKTLYAALTGFSDEFKERLSKMETEGLIKMVRACFVVHHGIWTREQVEMIVLGSEHPDRILSGSTYSTQRHLYYHDLLHARATVMTGMLDRALIMRSRFETDDSVLEMEDDFIPVSLCFNGPGYFREVECNEDLPIPWLADDKSEHFVQAGVKFEILIRARDRMDLKRHLAEDIKHATDRHSQTKVPTFLLIPNELSESERLDWVAKCRASQIGLLICPEATINLDTQAAQKLSQSRILRQ